MKKGENLSFFEVFGGQVIEKHVSDSIKLLVGNPESRIFYTGI